MIKSISAKKQHCDFIDGLRGIAILMVMVNHWLYLGFKASHQQTYFSFLNRFFYAGNTGVILFFMVSAFTLYRSMTFRSQTESKPIRNFYIRRFFRIFPVWWLCIFVYAFIQNVSIFEYLIHFPMLFGFTPFRRNLFGGEWTLFVEELFYLFLPLTLMIVKSFRGSILFLIGTYLLRELWLYVGPLYFSTGNPYSLFHSLFPLSHFYAFALGAVILHLYNKKIWIDKINNSVPYRSALEIVTLSSLLICLGVEGWGKGDDLSAFALALLFIASIPETTLFGKIARSEWLQKFGICCYSIYLFHVAVLGYFNKFLSPYIYHFFEASTLPIELKFLMTFPVFAFISLGVGMVCFKAIEMPCVNLGKLCIQKLEKKGAKGPFS